MKSLPLVILAVVLFFAFKYFYYKPKFIIGTEAPNFEATFENGQKMSLEAYKGKYVLLDFWGSWCGPCRKENPHLVNLYDDFHGKKFNDGKDFEIISIAIETEKKSWEKAVKVDQLRWDSHIVEMDRFSSPLPTLYGVKEIPTTYLVNPQGTIVGVNMTYKSINDFLSGKLNNKK